MERFPLAVLKRTAELARKAAELLGGGTIIGTEVWEDGHEVACSRECEDNCGPAVSVSLINGCAA